MKHAVKIAIYALVLAVLLALTVIGAGIGYASLRALPPELPSLATLSPADKVVLGGDVKVDFTAVIPADRSISKLALECGKGSVAVRNIRAVRQRWEWSRSRWAISAVIRPLSAGTVEEGPVTVELSPGRKQKKAEEFKVAIPEFASVIPATEKAGSELQLAGSMDVLRSGKERFLAHIANYKYIYAICLVLAAAAVIILVRLYKRSSRQEPVFSWDAAIAALEVLQTDIDSGNVLPKTGFTRLNDILRNYLEARFALPASRSTTPEFLAQMADRSSPLPEKCREQLADFLTTADMVRFAQEHADKMKLEHFLRKVVLIVRDTIPERSE